VYARRELMQKTGFGPPPARIDAVVIRRALPTPRVVARMSAGGRQPQPRQRYKYFRVHRAANQPPRWMCEKFNGNVSSARIAIIDTWAELHSLVLTSRPSEYDVCTDFNPTNGGGHWERVMHQDGIHRPVRTRFSRAQDDLFRQGVLNRVGPLHRHHLP
jgi:hypothetical protein